MPARFRRRKRVFKRRGRTIRFGKKGNSMKRPTVKLLRSPLMADRLFVKLKYVQRIPLVITSGATDIQYFRANSMYDPDYSGAGVQPTGFDQYMTFYQRWRVHASSCKLQVSSIGTTAPAQNFQIVMTPETAVANYTDIDSASASVYAKQLLFNINTNVNTIKLFSTTRKQFGLNKETVATENDFTGDASNDLPAANQWWWAIYVNVPDRTSTGTLYGFFTVTYFCEFYKRLDINLS